ncbi:MAG: AAA family ATPase [Gemmatimonadaceae bacterium]|nr:AAA family ATPase [Gemmatimonadaceae bacterium]
MIALRALGKAEIVTPTARLTPSQEILFAAALYLFLERAKPVGRTTLAETLWPGIADSARQHRLRQTIFQLKQAGVPLEATRESVLLPADARNSDLDVLFVHDAGDIGTIESLQFLPGYAPTFSDEFSRWLDTKRNEVSAATSRLLINDIRRARSRGDWLRVERLAFRCMEVDPFNEEAVLARAEASAMRGAKREAVTMLDQFVADLGVAAGEIKLPANLMRKRIAERMPEAAFNSRAESIFVGREPDMNLLTTLLDDARDGKGRCCLLWGDAGIGKSRLAVELGNFGELQGVQVRRVACRRGDAQRPLSVFVEAVPQLREMRGALGCSADTMADLQRLTQFDIGSAPKSAMELDPQSIFELIRLAIFDLIDAVSEEQCLMLVVEDVHWLDAASARILGQLADWAANKQLLLLFTSRLRENPLLEACTRAGLVTHHLRPLSNDASASLVREMFDATNERGDEEFLAWCRTVGDGNPFFLHELVKQWLETKQRHVIPPSITTVIRERFSRLSSEGTQLLQACSVLGENSTLPRVEKMLQQEPYMLLGALNELSKASMLSPERKPIAGSKDFKLAPKHDLIATVAVEELDPHAAAFLHRRAGEVLESELGENTQDTALLWACAQHWQKAGDEERAYQVGRIYAESLLDLGLASDAGDAFAILRRYCRGKPTEVEVLALAVTAFQIAHRWTDVITTVGLIRAALPDTTAHDVYETQMHHALWRSSDDLTLPLRNAMNCMLESSATAEHRIRSANLAMKMASDINSAEAMDEIYRLVTPIQPEEDSDEILKYELEMVYFSARGDIELTLSSIAQVLTAVRRSKQPSLTQFYFSNCSTALRIMGKFADARHLLEEAIEAALSGRLYVRAKYLMLQLIRLDLAEGKVSDARRNLDRASAWEFPQEDSITLVQERYLKARVLLNEGKIEEAKLVIAPALAAQDGVKTAFRGPVLATAVRVATLQQRFDSDASEMVNELERIHLRDRASGWNDFEAFALISALVAMGKATRATQLLTEYLTEFRRDQASVPKYFAELFLAS